MHNYNKLTKTFTSTKKIAALYLIELIMSMLIISISFTSVIMTTYIVNKAPNKKDVKQAIQIGNNYLNEILVKDFPASIPCPLSNNDEICNNLNINENLKNTCRINTANRKNFTNICQYDNLINYGAKDVVGDPIPGLENFTIIVNIVTSNQAVLDNLSGNNSNINEAQIARIDVTVIKDNMQNILLSTYKSKYL